MRAGVGGQSYRSRTVLSHNQALINDIRYQQYGRILARLAYSLAVFRRVLFRYSYKMGMIKKKTAVRGTEGGVKYVCDSCSADITSTV